MEMEQIQLETIAIFATAAHFIYLLAELVYLHFVKRRLDLRVTRMNFLSLATLISCSVLMTRILGPVTVLGAAYAGAKLSVFQVEASPLAWVYGLVVYEFFYWLQHWLAHKVRFLWCIHSPHHAPRGINMAIGANHFFAESLLYFTLFLGFLPGLFGVAPLIVMTINIVDSMWGSFLHISPDVVREGRYGFLGRVLQTPSHHRVHHAKNPRYMDRNYNSITLLWDKLLGTLEPLHPGEPVEYGITREVDDGSLIDVHAGEFAGLWRDLRQAKSWKDRFGFLLRPPGWQPGDDSKTAKAVRAAWAESTTLAD